jgi:hypothetical protein
MLVSFSGWTGSDCSLPMCSQTCRNNGNCTNPNICTCERGWAGSDCSIPLCAQDCLNGGTCVAPDQCQCQQWPNQFRDGRAGGGKPLYQDEFGNPQLTGGLFSFPSSFLLHLTASSSHQDGLVTTAQHQSVFKRIHSFSM